jgi:sugar phosphate permease
MEIALLAPVAGLLIDRLGPRKLIFIGVLITGLGLILLSQVSTLFGFYCSFILIATGNSTCIGVIPITVAGYWFHRRVSFATGIAVSGVAIGGVLVPVVTSIIDAFGWRTAMVIFGMGAWMIILPLSLIVRHRPEQYGCLPDGDKRVESLTPKNITPMQETNTDMDLRQALRTRAFWHLEIGFMFHVLAVYAVLTHIMPYLSTIGIARTNSRFIAGAIPVLSILGRLSFGWIGDKWDKRRVTAAGIAITAVSLLSFGYIDRLGTWLLVPFLLFFSIGYGGPVPMVAAVLRKNFGRTHLGSIIGLAQGLAVMGTVTGTPLAGWIFDTYGRYQGVWIAYAIITFVGALSVLTSPKQTGKG